jgi:hypothetical protein
MTRRSLPLLALLLLFNATASALDPVLVVTPRAQVVPASPVNRPFLGAAQAAQPVDLAARGYVESELRISGRANVHDSAPAADAAQVRVANVPYVTRMLVRQPRDVARFSGRVIVELLDAADGYDTAPLWGLSWEYFTRRGDVWVGVTVSPAAAEALRRFDNVRYQAISLAVPQNRCSNASADTGALAWDVIAQAGALLRSSSKENPLLALNPLRFIAAGYGLGGGYLSTYADALHAWQRLGDGAPIFDGYVNVAGLNAVAIDPCAAAVSEVRAAAAPRDVPYVMVLAESDAAATATLREDSDAPVFRVYEIAGMGRVGAYAAGQPAVADLKIAGQPSTAPSPAEGWCREARGNLATSFAINAIWQQLDEWLLHQVPMNKEPRFETDANGVMRDEAGNARGGWHLPQTDVPVASYHGSSTPRTGDAHALQLCGVTPSAQPMTVAALKARYGSRAEYLRRYNAAVDEALRQRRVVAEDVPALKALAQRAPAF